MDNIVSGNIAGAGRPATTPGDGRPAVPLGETRATGNGLETNAGANVLGKLWTNLGSARGQPGSSPSSQGVGGLLDSSKPQQGKANVLLGGSLGMASPGQQEHPAKQKGFQLQGQTGLSKNSPVTPVSGFYREHGPAKTQQPKLYEPTLEERFWQFTPDLPDSDDSDDSADERALVNPISLDLFP